MLIIIQARSNSKRFPNKVMFKINKKPIIMHVIENLKRSKFTNQILVATSNTRSDDNLTRYLKSINVDFYRGNLNNVAKKTF